MKLKTPLLKGFISISILLSLVNCPQEKKEQSSQGTALAALALQMTPKPSSKITVSTLAVTGINQPEAITVGSDGAIYITDSKNNQIKKIVNETTVTILADTKAGQGTSGPELNNPEGIAIDKNGVLYVANTGTATVGNNIVKIAVDGTATNYAGTYGARSFANGTLTAARFSKPEGIFYNAITDRIIVADVLNYQIRSISTTEVTTTVGSISSISGYLNANGTTALLNEPKGVVVDSSGNILFADSKNNSIRKISTTGDVTTLAGSIASESGATDGNGISARFNGPYGLAIDASNNVYVADGANQTIRKVTSTGVVTTVAGLAGTDGNTDGTASVATFSKPRGLAFNKEYTILYVSTTGGGTNSKIRKILF
ncbi:MAG TPA: hypothetical protein PLX69_13995 [Leptospiraceae bacterium]|nr:hypothetical protein [Leptospiraceae bacterium]HRG75669.1 hypothetical protein [Leptospiraceae bacterium]